MIPKDYERNLLFRRELLMAAEAEPHLQTIIRTACARSLLFWINATCFTYRQKFADADGNERPIEPGKAHWPMTTWPYQDHALLQIESHINQGKDLLIDKSRDMGATWLCSLVMLHQFLYCENRNFLMLSRKEDLVDKPGNPDSLFWKLDYVIKHLPRWLVPAIDRSSLHFGNATLNSTIDGESTTGDASQGGRRTAILLDEFARVQDGFGILNATADTTACRIFNSTPNGMGTAFSTLRFSGKIDVLELHWSIHPEKGRNRREVADPMTGAVKFTSPWYENECDRRVSKREIAENLDIDHHASGNMFFDSQVITNHARKYSRPPLAIGHIRYEGFFHPEHVEKKITARETRGLQFESLAAYPKQGCWRLWLDLDEETGRPRQDTRYVFAADIGAGVGASNSVISVGDLDDRRKVAEFVSCYLKPADLAMVCMQAMLWFGGDCGWPFHIWERNGPGGAYTHEIIRIGWSSFYYMRQTDTRSRKVSDKPGWLSTRANKQMVLETYGKALARDEFANPSAEAINEAQGYVYYESGGIGPANMVEEAEGAREAHGDRVIADMLLNWGFREAPKYRAADAPPPQGSMMHRILQRRRTKENLTIAPLANWGDDYGIRN